MATVRPFAALRPRVDVASKVAALPYDVYNRAEALAEIAKEPLSFLKVDRPDTFFPEDSDPYAPEVYEKAKEVLDQMIQEGIFLKEDKPCYYIYDLTMDGRSQTGLVGCAAIDDYLNNVIKKHENTREEKEVDRINHVEVCNAQTGPIFLAYRSHAGIKEVTERVKQGVPLYDFVAPDKVRHTVWVISEAEDLAKIREGFAEVESVYIADGHHRAASAVKVGLKRRQENSNYTGEEEFNFFLSVLFPEDQLMIMDYNRVVKDLNGLPKAEFLAQVEKSFRVEEVGKTPYKPQCKGTFGMYLEGTWYKLEARPEILSQDPVEGLDVSLLQNHLLAPILAIKDVRTDKRIDFVGGIRGLTELEKRANEDMKLAFALYPTSIAELFAVADAGQLMPPKSTWFEPKLRSGLFIHELD